MNDEFKLPILSVEADNCSEAWIKSVKAVWDHGKMMPQHYEEELSKEATVTVNILNPLKKPRIHPADYVGTQEIRIKKSYTKEVLEGTIDHLVDKGSLSYTYHRRLWHWGKKVQKHDDMLEEQELPTLESGYITINGVNQIAYLLQKIQEESISRKLQVTTWCPWKDLKIRGAPCLQRIWLRVIEDKYIVAETMWRSRDLFKAFSSNIYGMVELADKIAKKVGMKLVQMVDISNSLHLYASDFEEIKRNFKIMKKRGMKI